VENGKCQLNNNFGIITQKKLGQTKHRGSEGEECLCKTQYLQELIKVENCLTLNERGIYNCAKYLSPLNT